MARLGSDRPQAAIADRLRRSAPALIAIFLFWWLLTAGVYRQTSSNFLRAESGWFLFLSHSDPGVQRRFEKILLTKNFWGHYAPVALIAEFETAKVAGTRGAFWKWRQITALAVAATILFLLVRISSSAFGLTNARAFLSAGALTAILIFQVQMQDFIAWPFMILQLGWLLFSLLALLSLVRIVQRPGEKRWPWLGAAAAYASLHCLGLGIATVFATGATMIGILVVRRKGAAPQPKIAAPLVSLSVFGMLHAIAMQRFMRIEPILPSTGWQPGQFLVESLGFIPNFAFATVRGLFSVTPFKPEPSQIGQQWPGGLALVLALALVVGLTSRRFLRNPNACNHTRFVLHSFASIAFLTIVTLIAVREWSEASPGRFADYLSGPRYLIPASLALVAILFELFLLIGSLPTVPSVILNLALGICAIAGHLHFAAHIYPRVAPAAMIPHDRAWRSIVIMARECRQAGLAVPNLPLGQLTQEFSDWDLKLFEPLLRSDLNVPPQTDLAIAPWKDFADKSPDQYSRQVPTLAKIRSRLSLDPPKR
jgi:hypothetical protein